MREPIRYRHPWWRYLPSRAQYNPRQRQSQHESVSRYRTWKQPTHCGRQGRPVQVRLPKPIRPRRCENTRSMIIAKKAKLSGNRAADRVNCLSTVQRAGGGMNQGLCQSFAAIGKRQKPAFRLRIATLNAASHRLCDCFSRSGLLERVRCQQNPHTCLLLRLHPYSNAVPGQRLSGSPPTWAGGTGCLRIPPTWRSDLGRACVANAAARHPSWRIPH